LSPAKAANGWLTTCSTVDEAAPFLNDITLAMYGREVPRIGL
jgi:hypothetical protein